MSVEPFSLSLPEAEIAELQSCLTEILHSGDLILGRFTAEFERRFAEYCGCQHAVSLNSGTSALEVLIRIHKGTGRRIAVPTNTNFATVAAILRAGGLPVFLDMELDNFMPNLEILKAAHERQALAGVVWVHIGGLITPDFPDVVQFCREQNLFIIEDAAHAHGSRLAGTNAGTFADGGAFSFFPTKVMTTMEGGMVTTNDEETSRLVRSYRNQGKGEAKYGGKHYHLGNSWRMLEIAAAMGILQLRRLDETLVRREKAASRIKAALDEACVGYCDSAHMDRASNYKLIVRVNSNTSVEVIKQRFLEKGVVLGGGVYEIPCHMQPVFSDIPRPRTGFPVAEMHCPRHICPPLTSDMSESDLDRVATAIQEVM